MDEETTVSVPPEIRDLLPEMTMKRTYTQDDNYRAYKLFSMMDVDGGGSISLRELNRMLLGEAVRFVEASFEHPDSGLLFGLDEEQCVIITDIEPDSTAKMFPFLIQRMRLNRINDFKVKQFDETSLQATFTELLRLHDAPLTLQFLEPTIIVNGFSSMLDIEVDDEVFSVASPVGAFYNHVIFCEKMQACLQQTAQVLQYITVSFSQKKRQVRFSSDIIRFRLLFASGPNFRRSCRYALGFSAEDYPLTRKLEGQPLIMDLGLGINAQKTEILMQELFKQYDRDDSGEFEFEEFRDFYIRYLDDEESQERLRKYANYRFRDIEMEKFVRKQKQDRLNKLRRREFIKIKYAKAVQNQKDKFRTESHVDQYGIRRRTYRHRTANGMTQPQQLPSLATTTTRSSTGVVGITQESNIAFSSGMTSKKPFSCLATLAEEKEAGEDDGGENELDEGFHTMEVDKYEMRARKRFMKKQKLQAQTERRKKILRKIVEANNRLSMQLRHDAKQHQEAMVSTQMMELHFQIKKILNTSFQIKPTEMENIQSYGLNVFGVISSPAINLDSAVFGQKLTTDSFDLGILPASKQHPATMHYYLLKEQQKSHKATFDPEYLHPAWFTADYVRQPSRHSYLALSLVRVQKKIRDEGVAYRYSKGMDRVLVVPPEEDLALIRRQRFEQSGQKRVTFHDLEPNKESRKGLLARMTISTIKISELGNVHIFEKNSPFVRIESSQFKFATEIYSFAGDYCAWDDLDWILRLYHDEPFKISALSGSLHKPVLIGSHSMDPQHILDTQVDKDGRGTLTGRLMDDDRRYGKYEIQYTIEKGLEWDWFVASYQARQAHLKHFQYEKKIRSSTLNAHDEDGQFPITLQVLNMCLFDVIKSRKWLNSNLLVTLDIGSVEMMSKEFDPQIMIDHAEWKRIDWEIVVPSIEMNLVFKISSGKKEIGRYIIDGKDLKSRMSSCQREMEFSGDVIDTLSTHAIVGKFMVNFFVLKVSTQQQNIGTQSPRSKGEQEFRLIALPAVYIFESLEINLLEMIDAFEGDNISVTFVYEKYNFKAMVFAKPGSKSITISDLDWQMPIQSRKKAILMIAKNDEQFAVVHFQSDELTNVRFGSAEDEVLINKFAHNSTKVCAKVLLRATVTLENDTVAVNHFLFEKDPYHGVPIVDAVYSASGSVMVESNQEFWNTSQLESSMIRDTNVEDTLPAKMVVTEVTITDLKNAHYLSKNSPSVSIACGGVAKATQVLPNAGANGIWAGIKMSYTLQQDFTVHISVVSKEIVLGECSVHPNVVIEARPDKAGLRELFFPLKNSKGAASGKLKVVYYIEDIVKKSVPMSDIQLGLHTIYDFPVLVVLYSITILNLKPVHLFRRNSPQVKLRRLSKSDHEDFTTTALISGGSYGKWMHLLWNLVFNDELTTLHLQVMSDSAVIGTVSITSEMLFGVMPRSDGMCDLELPLTGPADRLSCGDIRISFTYEPHVDVPDDIDLEDVEDDISYAPPSVAGSAALTAKSAGRSVRSKAASTGVSSTAANKAVIGKTVILTGTTLVLRRREKRLFGSEGIKLQLVCGTFINAVQVSATRNDNIFQSGRLSERFRVNDLNSLYCRVFDRDDVTLGECEYVFYDFAHAVMDEYGMFSFDKDIFRKGELIGLLRLKFKLTDERIDDIPTSLGARQSMTSSVASSHNNDSRAYSYLSSKAFLQSSKLEQMQYPLSVKFTRISATDLHTHDDNDILGNENVILLATFNGEVRRVSSLPHKDWLHIDWESDNLLFTVAHDAEEWLFEVSRGAEPFGIAKVLASDLRLASLRKDKQDSELHCNIWHENRTIGHLTFHFNVQSLFTAERYPVFRPPSAISEQDSRVEEKRSSGYFRVKSITVSDITTVLETFTNSPQVFLRIREKKWQTEVAVEAGEEYRWDSIDWGKIYVGRDDMIKLVVRTHNTVIGEAEVSAAEIEACFCDNKEITDVRFDLLRDSQYQGLVVIEMLGNFFDQAKDDANELRHDMRQTAPMVGSALIPGSILEGSGVATDEAVITIQNQQVAEVSFVAISLRNLPQLHPVFKNSPQVNLSCTTWKAETKPLRLAGDEAKWLMPRNRGWKLETKGSPFLKITVVSEQSLLGSVFINITEIFAAEVDNIGLTRISRSLTDQNGREAGEVELLVQARLAHNDEDYSIPDTASVYSIQPSFANVDAQTMHKMIDGITNDIAEVKPPCKLTLLRIDCSDIKLPPSRVATKNALSVRVSCGIESNVTSIVVTNDQRALWEEVNWQMRVLDINDNLQIQLFNKAKLVGIFSILVATLLKLPRTSQGYVEIDRLISMDAAKVAKIVLHCILTPVEVVLDEEKSMDEASLEIDTLATYDRIAVIMRVKLISLRDISLMGHECKVMVTSHNKSQSSHFVVNRHGVLIFPLPTWDDILLPERAFFYITVETKDGELIGTATVHVYEIQQSPLDASTNVAVFYADLYLGIAVKGKLGMAFERFTPQQYAALEAPQDLPPPPEVIPDPIPSHLAPGWSFTIVRVFLTKLKPVHQNGRNSPLLAVDFRGLKYFSDCQPYAGKQASWEDLSWTILCQEKGMLKIRVTSATVLIGSVSIPIEELFVDALDDNLELVLERKLFKERVEMGRIAIHLAGHLPQAAKDDGGGQAINSSSSQKKNIGHTTVVSLKPLSLGRTTADYEQILEDNVETYKTIVNFDGNLTSRSLQSSLFSRPDNSWTIDDSTILTETISRVDYDDESFATYSTYSDYDGSSTSRSGDDSTYSTSSRRDEDHHTTVSFVDTVDASLVSKSVPYHDRRSSVNSVALRPKTSRGPDEVKALPVVGSNEVTGSVAPMIPAMMHHAAVLPSLPSISEYQPQQSLAASNMSGSFASASYVSASYYTDPASQYSSSASFAPSGYYASMSFAYASSYHSQAPSTIQGQESAVDDASAQGGVSTIYSQQTYAQRPVMPLLNDDHSVDGSITPRTVDSQFYTQQSASYTVATSPSLDSRTGTYSATKTVGTYSDNNGSVASNTYSSYCTADQQTASSHSSTFHTAVGDSESGAASAPMVFVSSVLPSQLQHQRSSLSSFALFQASLVIAEPFLSRSQLPLLIADRFVHNILHQVVSSFVAMSSQIDFQVQSMLLSSIHLATSFGHGEFNRKQVALLLAARTADAVIHKGGTNILRHILRHQEQHQQLSIEASQSFPHLATMATPTSPVRSAALNSGLYKKRQGIMMASAKPQDILVDRRELEEDSSMFTWEKYEAETTRALPLRAKLYVLDIIGLDLSQVDTRVLPLRPYITACKPYGNWAAETNVIRLQMSSKLTKQDLELNYNDLSGKLRWEPLVLRRGQWMVFDLRDGGSGGLIIAKAAVNYESILKNLPKHQVEFESAVFLPFQIANEFGGGRMGGVMRIKVDLGVNVFVRSKKSVAYWDKHRAQHWQHYPLIPINFGVVRQKYRDIADDYDRQRLIHPSFFGFKVRFRGNPEDESRFLHPTFSSYNLARKNISGKIVGSRELTKINAALKSKSANPYRWDPTLKDLGKCPVCSDGLDGCPRCYMMPARADGMFYVPAEFGFDPLVERKRALAREQAMIQLAAKRRRRLSSLQMSSSLDSIDLDKLGISDLIVGNNTMKSVADLAQQVNDLYDLEKQKEVEKHDAEESKMAIHTKMTTFKSIRAFRLFKQRMMNIFIKIMPTGQVMRLTMDAKDPMFYLYQMFRSNHPLGNAYKPMLLLPTSAGLFELHSELAWETDLQMADRRGYDRLEEFHIDHAKHTYTLLFFEHYVPHAVPSILQMYFSSNTDYPLKTLPTYTGVDRIPKHLEKDKVQHFLTKLVLIEYGLQQANYRDYYQELGAAYKNSVFAQMLKVQSKNKAEHAFYEQQKKRLQMRFKSQIKRFDPKTRRRVMKILDKRERNKRKTQLFVDEKDRLHGDDGAFTDISASTAERRRKAEEQEEDELSLSEILLQEGLSATTSQFDGNGEEGDEADDYDEEEEGTEGLEDYESSDGGSSEYESQSEYSQDDDNDDEEDDDEEDDGEDDDQGEQAPPIPAGTGVAAVSALKNMNRGSQQTLPTIPSFASQDDEDYSLASSRSYTTDSARSKSESYLSYDSRSYYSQSSRSNSSYGSGSGTNTSRSWSASSYGSDYSSASSSHMPSVSNVSLQTFATPSIGSGVREAWKDLPPPDENTVFSGHRRTLYPTDISLYSNNLSIGQADDDQSTPATSVKSESIMLTGRSYVLSAVDMPGPSHGMFTYRSNMSSSTISGAQPLSSRSGLSSVSLEKIPMRKPNAKDDQSIYSQLSVQSATSTSQASSYLTTLPDHQSQILEQRLRSNIDSVQGSFYEEDDLLSRASNSYTARSLSDVSSLAPLIAPAVASDGRRGRNTVADASEEEISLQSPMMSSRASSTVDTDSLHTQEMSIQSLYSRTPAAGIKVVTGDEEQSYDSRSSSHYSSSDYSRTSDSRSYSSGTYASYSSSMQSQPPLPRYQQHSSASPSQSVATKSASVVSSGSKRFSGYGYIEAPRIIPARAAGGSIAEESLSISDASASNASGGGAYDGDHSERSGESRFVQQLRQLSQRSGAENSATGSISSGQKSQK